MPEPLIETDTLNQFNWDQKITTFDSEGNRIGLEVAYDNGAGRLYAYDAGVVTQLIETDAPDGQLYNWETRTSFYNLDGSLEARETAYDNGVLRIETYQSGQLDQIQQTDNADTQSWTSINSYYSGGTLDATVIIYDDGRETVREYQSGVLSRELQTDRTAPGDPQGQDWDTIDTYYNANGGLAARQTIFDNGVEKLEEYIYGELQQITQTDRAGDARPWETVTTYFHFMGPKAAEEIRYDDGRVTVTQWTDQGVRESIEAIDQTHAGHPEGQVWERINTYFDANGLIAFRETRFDDGVVKTENYSGGQIESVRSEDQSTGSEAKPWEMTEAFFDSDGMVFRHTVFDDGVTRDENFMRGQRVELQETDNFHTHNWESRTTTFNEDFGYVNGRTVVADNGITTEIGYNQGQLSVREQTDTQNAADWQTRLTTYGEDGKADRLILTYDDGDVRTIAYAEDGRTVAIRIDEDKNESDAWGFRVVDYRGDLPVIGLYDSYDSLLADYQDALNFEYTVTL